MSEFGIRAASEDGLSPYCRPCAAAYQRERRIATGLNKPPGWARKTADPEYVLEYRRSYVKAHRQQVNNTKRAWLKKNPLRERAKDAVKYAIRVGKLTRQPCAVCSEVKVEAHHPDYSKPLDVVWLCRSCHQDMHRKTREKDLTTPG